MRAIVTVLGTDKAGIIANVSDTLFKSNVNILDISQTILEEYFAMIMLVDLTELNISFESLKEQLKTLGEKIGVQIRIQREEIFNAMHRI
ncbi:MAG: ACT domain-containing protein [Eubacteriales bacterium]